MEEVSVKGDLNLKITDSDKTNLRLELRLPDIQGLSSKVIYAPIPSFSSNNIFRPTPI